MWCSIVDGLGERGSREDGREGEKIGDKEMIELEVWGDREKDDGRAYIYA